MASRKCFLCKDGVKQNQRKPLSGILRNPSYSVGDGLREVFRMAVDDTDLGNGFLCTPCYGCLLRACVNRQDTNHANDGKPEHLCEVDKNNSLSIQECGHGTRETPAAETVTRASDKSQSGTATKAIDDHDYSQAGSIVEFRCNDYTVTRTPVSLDDSQAGTIARDNMHDMAKESKDSLSSSWSLCFLCNDRFEQISSQYYLRKPLDGTINSLYTIREGLLQIFGVTVSAADYAERYLCLPCYKNLAQACNKRVDAKMAGKILTKSTAENGTMFAGPSDTVTSGVTLQPTDSTNMSPRSLCFLCNNGFERSYKSKQYLRKPLRGIINPVYSIREGLLQIYGVTVDDADYAKGYLCLQCYRSLACACDKKMEEAFSGKESSNHIKWTVEHGEDSTLSVQQSEPPQLNQAAVSGPFNDPENVPMANKLCFMCNKRFKTKAHGYNRTPLRGAINKPAVPLCSIKEGLSQMHGVIVNDDICQKCFLCTPCYNDLTVLCRKHFVQRKAPGSHAESTASNEAVEREPTTCQVLPQKREKMTGVLVRVWRYLFSGSYIKAFRLLLSHSSSAKKHFRKVMVDQIKKELQHYTSSTRFAEVDTTAENVDSFDWATFLTEVQDCLPFIYDAVSAVKRKKKHYRAAGKFQIFGSIFGQLLFMHNPRYRVFQRFNSIQVWTQGGSQKVLRYLQRLGVTLGVGSTQTAVDKVVEQHDPEILAPQQQQMNQSKPQGANSATQDDVANTAVTEDDPQDKSKRHLLLARPTHEDIMRTTKRKHDLLDSLVCGDAAQNQKKPRPPLNQERRSPLLQNAEDGAEEQISNGNDAEHNTQVINSDTDSCTEDVVPVPVPVRSARNKQPKKRCECCV